MSSSQLSGTSRPCATELVELLDVLDDAVDHSRDAVRARAGGAARAPRALLPGGGHRRARIRRRRQAQGHPGRGPVRRRTRGATSSSSTCGRRNATTRRRRCTATTRSTASSSTGSRNRADPAAAAVQRYIDHQREAAASCSSSATRSVRARDPAVHVPRPGELRRPPRRTASCVHLAAAGPDAGGAVRDRSERGGGVGGRRRVRDLSSTAASSLRRLHDPGRV